MKLLYSILLLALPAAGQSDRGWTVLEAALKAAGGREKLAAVKDMSFELQSRVVMPQGEMELQSRNSFVLPDTVRQEIKMPLGELKIAFNSSEGWRQSPQGVEKIPPDQVRRTQAHLARVNVLFRPPKDRSSVRWVKSDTVDGRACDLIDVTNLGGDPLRLFVDRATGDVIKRTYRVEDSGGKMSDVEEILSDFQTVDGLRLSFKVREMRNGKLARESTTSNMKLNTGLKADDLLRDFRASQ